MRNIHPSRRLFIKTLGTTGLSLCLPAAAAKRLRQLAKPLRIGMIADLHQDIMHDGDARMEAFLKEMTQSKPDALMQLGDFAYPNAKNKTLIDRFNQAQATTLHVIGNHDTDAGHTKQQCLDFWNMPGRYYRHDVGGLRMLVLDGNDKGSPTAKGGYASYIGKEQIEWLEKELAQHDGPIAIASHQPLAGHAAVDNARQLQDILGRHAEKIVLCINGHTHIDCLLEKQGVSYLHINSASYLWVGGNYKHNSYPEAIHKKHPWINRTCPYRDSLFTTLTFDPASGTIKVKGKESRWVGKSPAQLGMQKQGTATVGQEIAPRISARNVTTSSAHPPADTM